MILLVTCPSRCCPLLLRGPVPFTIPLSDRIRHLAHVTPVVHTYLPVVLLVFEPLLFRGIGLGNSLYTLARYGRRWEGRDVAQTEPGTPVRGHLADGARTLERIDNQINTFILTSTSDS